MAGAVTVRAGGKSSAGEYELHRSAVLGMLAKRFPRLYEDERLALYHEAWARVYDKRRRGERIESLRAYLIATAGGEALNLLTRRRPAPLEPDDRRLSEIADERPGVDEQVVVRDQARIARDLIDTLDRRQREVVKLRFDLQLEADEVRAALGLSRRQYQRLMEEGAAAIAERVRELDTGEWSRRQRSLVTACLVEMTAGGRRRAGVVSERRRREAQRLVESDPHVAALLAEVRGALGRAAALLPLPALFPDEASAAAGSVGDGVADGADHVASEPASAVELVAAARGAIAETARTAKQHALSLYVRAADPALLSSPRPGTAVAAVAASLAVGGGAYGAYEAVSSPAPAPAVATPVDAAPAPESTFTTTHASPDGERQERRRAHRPQRDRKSTRRKDHDALQPTAPPDETSQPAPAPPPPAPPPPAGDEFGFEQ